MTDLPLSRLSHAQRERRDRMRKRCGWNEDRIVSEHCNISWNLPPTAILQDWHLDEHGCRARRAGCGGDG